jgi:6-phosphogluconolactonase
MKWRLLLLAGLFLAGVTLALPARRADEAPKKYMVYFGTYTGGKSEGIYRCTFDPATGELGKPALAAKVKNPTFLAIHPTGKFVYAVGEISDFGGTGKPAGAISAFRVKDDGDLELLNQESSGGAGPCHIIVDRAGKNVLAANYGGGSACVLQIDKDGKVKKATGFKQHKGKSVDKARQEGPHAHSINLDSANKFAFVADLGLDKVLIYKFDAEAGKIEDNDPPFVKTEAGGGPRHFAFHPTEKFAYCCNEMTSKVTAMKFDKTSGKLEVMQTISTLPEPTKGNSTAEVVVHPSGKFLYCSNRGHNSIAIFTIDEKTGKLTAAGHQGKGIKIPRNFALDPTGKFCLVASQNGGDVKVFKVDQKTGKLEPTENKASVTNPVCVRFLAWK